MDCIDVDVADKPFCMLLSGLSNSTRNHLHLRVSMEIGVSDIPRSIIDVPKYLVLKLLNDVSVGLFRASPTAVCRRATQASIFVCTASANLYRQGLSSSHEPIHFLLF
jgi:hypothetical protein